MNKTMLLTVSSLLAALLAPPLSRGEDFLLYTSKPAEGDQAPASPDKGILVRSVTIKEGDTLADLSRKYLGRGSWFPQLIPFNSIKNPDLIHTGDKLLVPVPAGQVASEKKVRPARKQARGKKHHGGLRAGHRGVANVRAESALAKPEPAARESFTSNSVLAKMPPLQSVSSAEQEKYLQAKLTYLEGDYQTSLTLFTAFLRKFPNSTSSADASLFRADCLLHLSGH